MQPLPSRLDPRVVEAASASFWVARGLTDSPGPVGPATGPLVHLLLGTIFPLDSELTILQRLVAADAEARYLGMMGSRTWTTVQLASLSRSSPLPGALRRAAEFGVRVRGLSPTGAGSNEAHLQAMLERLAKEQILVSREEPVRSCLRCRMPRTLETIIYQEEDAPTYLLRFQLRGVEPPTSAIVWTDSAWKLLGTTAVLLNPDRPYVRVKFCRRGTEERILLARSALPRLKEWLPGCEFEVEEERTGSDWALTGYVHPLALEYPAVADLPSPAGTLVGSSEVGDHGTGLVPLVPSHGRSDSIVAQAEGLPGWPIVGLDGHLDVTLAHKYGGLTVDVGEAFILRDLADGGFLFAEVKAPRGVPHCAFCGSGLVWISLRAWHLNPSRLPPDPVTDLARLLPGESSPRPDTAIRWPASESTLREDNTGLTLRECSRCERLLPPAADATCPCGGTNRPVSRTLLPAVREALNGLGRHSPFRAGEEVRIFLSDRRRTPALLHMLMGLEAAGHRPGSVRVHLLPTLPHAALDDSAPALEPRDAVRLALLRTERSPRVEPTFRDRRIQEARRLRKTWEVFVELIETSRRSGFTGGPIVNATGAADLLPEDRAFLSRFEGMRLDVLRQFETGDLSAAVTLLTDFMERDLQRGYLNIARRRLGRSGPAPEKVGALQVLWHVLPLWVELFAPLAPFTSEALHRALRGDTQSVFQRRFTPIQDGLRDPKAETNYATWKAIDAVIQQGRRRMGIVSTRPLPNVVLVARDEPVATELRTDLEVVRRLAGAEHVVVASPGHPWEGKRVEVKPVLEEIQKAYSTQAPRIVRMIEQLPGRRVQEGLRRNSLSVTIDGRTIQLLSTMLEVGETLPARFVAVPWAQGDLFVEVPADHDLEGSAAILGLSLGGFLAVRDLRRRLRRAAEPKPPIARIWAQEPLGAELGRMAVPIGHSLGVELRVDGDQEGYVDTETSFGGVRRGARWATWVPGLTVPTHARKHRPVRSSTPRVVLREVPVEDGSDGPDFLDEGMQAQAQSVRDMVERLDAAMGIPIVGPTKLSFAWEAGLQTFEAVTTAPFARLAAIPGFGPYVAGEIIRHFGGSVPTTLSVRPGSADPTMASSPRPTPSTEPLGPEEHSIEPSLEVGSLAASVLAGEGRTAPMREGEERAVPHASSTLPPEVDPSFSDRPGSELTSATFAPSDIAARSSAGEESSPVVPDRTAEDPTNPAVAEVGEGRPFSLSRSAARTEAAIPEENSAMVSPEDPLPPASSAAEPEVAAGEPAVVPVLEASLAGPAEVSDASPEVGPERFRPAEPSVNTPRSEPEPVVLPQPALDGTADQEPAPIREAHPHSDAPVATTLLQGEGESPAAVSSGPLPTPPDSGMPLPAPGSELEEPFLPSEPNPEPSAGASQTDSVTGPVSLPESAMTIVTEMALPSEEEESLASPIAESPAEAGPLLPDLPFPGVSVPPAPVPAAPPPSGVELWIDRSSDAAWHRFLESTGAGLRGLCLSREFPDRLRGYLGPRDVALIWIANAGRENAVRPSDLEGIESAIRKGLSEGHAAVVYLSGTEYLLSLHSTEGVLGFLKRVDGVAHGTLARVIVPLDPSLIPTAKTELLRDAFSVAPPP